MAYPCFSLLPDLLSTASSPSLYPSFLSPLSHHHLSTLDLSVSRTSPLSRHQSLATPPSISPTVLFLSSSVLSIPQPSLSTTHSLFLVSLSALSLRSHLLPPSLYLPSLSTHSSPPFLSSLPLIPLLRLYLLHHQQQPTIAKTTQHYSPYNSDSTKNITTHQSLLFSDNNTSVNNSKPTNHNPQPLPPISPLLPLCFLPPLRRHTATLTTTKQPKSNTTHTDSKTPINEPNSNKNNH